MLAKYHHVDNLQKIEQVDIKSLDILNQTELTTNPYECNKGVAKTLEIKVTRYVGHYNHGVF